MTPSSGSRPMVSSWMRSSSTPRSLAMRPTVWTWWTLLRCMSGRGRLEPWFFGLPVPGQKLVQPMGGMLGDEGQHVCEPSLWVDVVELGGDDQAVEDGGALAAAI